LGKAVASHGLVAVFQVQVFLSHHGIIMTFQTQP
jgi:hypothetical protein